MSARANIGSPALRNRCQAQTDTFLKQDNASHLSKQDKSEPSKWDHTRTHLAKSDMRTNKGKQKGNQNQSQLLLSVKAHSDQHPSLCLQITSETESRFQDTSIHLTLRSHSRTHKGKWYIGRREAREYGCSVVRIRLFHSYRQLSLSI